MKGKLVLVLCILFLLSFLSCARFGQTETEATSILPVHNLSTGLSYASIQEAIDANETLNGQTIVVDDGTYYENVVVNKSITLIGQNRDNTIVEGNSSGSAFTLKRALLIVNIATMKSRKMMISFWLASFQVLGRNGKMYV